MSLARRQEWKSRRIPRPTIPLSDHAVFISASSHRGEDYNGWIWLTADTVHVSLMFAVDVIKRDAVVEPLFLLVGEVAKAIPCIRT